MPALLEVFVIGESVDLPGKTSDPNASMQLRLIPTCVRTLGEFLGTTWAKQLVEGEGEFAAVVCGNVREAISDMRMTVDLGLGSDVAAVVTADRVDQGDSPADPTFYKGIGRGIRILLAPPAGHGPIIFRRNSLKKVGPLESVPEPVWDWLIRRCVPERRSSRLRLDSGQQNVGCHCWPHRARAMTKSGSANTWRISHQEISA